MTELDNAIENLIVTIKDTDKYKRYKREKDKVNLFPELKTQIDIFRARNFELQNMTGDEDLFYKIEEFEREYEKFRENPLVADFLAAELDLCRMMQDVNARLAEALDFE
ncbi:MAG: YlbF family regulator [Lachnospiraceae bacterium]|nr:YlbF family regulator [Lachnospiraceae bacterium]